MPTDRGTPKRFVIMFDEESIHDMSPDDPVNDELVDVFSKLPATIIVMVNEALERYVEYGHWNAYNAEDLEKLSKMTGYEKVHYTGHFRVTHDGDELSDVEMYLAEKFMDALMDALPVAEAREESLKMIDDIEDYLKGDS